MHTDGRRGTRGKGGRGRGAGRGKRGKKADVEGTTDTPTITNVPEESRVPVDADVKPMEVDQDEPEMKEEQENVAPPPIDIEADISQLEAPTFTTITRGPPEPMLRLKKWNHKVLLIGEKVLNPMIHCCDRCELPILTYGRMIPCKHVFCLVCAKHEQASAKEAAREFVCPRCLDKVGRVEQSGLGSVFMCTHGGTRYNNKGCRRTYLSQRDLQAHINHRHVAVVQPAATQATVTTNCAPAGARSGLEQEKNSLVGVDGKTMARKTSAINIAATTPGTPSTPNTFRPVNVSSVRTNLMNMQESVGVVGAGANSSGGDLDDHFSRGHWSTSTASTVGGVGGGGQQQQQQQSQQQYYR